MLLNIVQSDRLLNGLRDMAQEFEATDHERHMADVLALGCASVWLEERAVTAILESVRDDYRRLRAPQRTGDKT